MPVPAMQNDPKPTRLTDRNLIKFVRLLCTLAMCAILGGTKSLAGEADAESNVENPAAKLNAGTEPMWHFTSYLKGTTAQVRQQLNGEVERLMAKTRTTKKAIADYKAAIAADEKASTDRLRKDARYVSLKADLKQAEADLETARKKGTPQDRLDASSRCNHLRAAVEQMENDALAKDQGLTDDRAALKEQTAGLKKHIEALDRAQKWRDTLIEAIQTSARLKWPLKPGEAGLLGKVTPLQIVDEHSIVVEYQAYEEVGKSGEQEEIQRIDVIPHRVKLLVTGINTKGLAEKQSVVLNKTFSVEKTDENGRYVVTQTPPSALDEFFDKVMPLRTIPDE